MAVLDAVRDVFNPDGEKIPSDVEERLKRGRNRMREGAPMRNMCDRFWRGEQYCFVNSENYLVAQSTVTNANGSGKPPHRVRQVNNLLTDPVRHEVSAGTSRVPSYEVAPSSTDPGTRQAAMFSEKVALFGFEEWKVRSATVDTITNAVVMDAGFARPYFDLYRNPPIGDICIDTFSRNEVYWEPGINFYKSPWWAIEQAKPVDEVMQMDGYIGGKLKADATTSEVLGRGKAPADGNLVLVTEYLERPSARNRQGRRLLFANKKPIAEPEPYPYVDSRGEPVDKPVLHKLAYIHDPNSDDDRGLVRDCIDPQRSFNDAWNKVLEFKNLALMPQLLAPTDSIRQRRTDEPGAIVYYDPVFGLKPEWAPTPSIPRELFEIMDRARQQIASVFSQNEIPSQVEAGKAIQDLLERDQRARASFLQELASFHASLMHHCLTLVQRHYSEDRLLKIQGRFGLELIEGFKGADLHNEVDVRVFPGSLEPKTKTAQQQQIMNYADRGWITPQQAMAAINGGTAENLAQGYELQVDLAQRRIQQILALAGTLDPDSPPDAYAKADIPEAQPSDDHEIHRDVIHQYQATVDYERQPDAVKQVLTLLDQQHEMLQAQAVAQQAQAQMEQAQGLGMSNAAKNPGPPKPPDMKGSDEAQV